MINPQVLISGLLLFLSAAVYCFPEVHGVVGHPVKLPCTYPVSNGISSMCWDQGECGDTCVQTLIWADGHKIYYQTNNRYQLEGQLLEGDVSLTIENTTESDSGLYCCRVEMKDPNGVQRLTVSLRVQPVYIITVTSSHHPAAEHTKVVPTSHPLISTMGLYIGIPVSVVLLLLTSILLAIKCSHRRKKKKESNSLCSPVVFHDYSNEAFEITVEPKDTVYTIEDNFYPRINSQLPSKMTSFQDCR
ncbi:hepatitis A virus cellular receptor 1 homolog [Mesocricetus auratus]|uniref:Hepatitis A virus cellular receptor 1 homolog n=1 Tax=Mesocricetus auratus TaxID=10036 RepID=A0ABM2XME5_MESAU|nr:hepatitis A virus cellular receptor 1 homolog [Mesocricetus auratus]